MRGLLGVAPLATHIPSGPGLILLAGGVLVVVGLSGGHLVRLGRAMIVCGWAVFALSSPTSQFPTILRPAGVATVAVGVALHAVASPPRPLGTGRPIAASTRFLLVYLVFVLGGALVSPFGPHNIFRWVEGAAIVGGAFYGVSIGLTEGLLIGTFSAAAVNVMLTVRSGAGEVIPGDPNAPYRLAGHMDPNHVGFAAAVVLIGAAWAIPRHRNLLVRAVLTGCAGVSSYALYACRSRSALFGCILALALMAASWVRSRGPAMRVAVWVASGLVALIPLLLPLTSKVVNRAGEGGPQSASAASVTSLTGRTDFWPLVVRMIEERPVIGWGINAIQYPPIAARFQAITQGAIQAHNSFLEASLMAGLPGGAAWTLSLLALVFGAFRLRRTHRYRLLVGPLGVLLLVFAFTESGPAWFGDMFIVFALCAAVYGAAYEGPRRPRPPRRLVAAADHLVAAKAAPA